MASKAGRLQIQLEMDVAALRRDLEKTNAEMRRATNSWTQAAKNFSIGFKQAFQFDFATRAVDAVSNAIREVMGRFDEIADGAKKIGVSAEAFQELSYAATQSGTSVDAMTAAVARMNKGMGEAAAGGGKSFVAGLDAIGLEMKDLQGLSPDKQFIRILDALSKVGDAAQRQAAGVAIFGKGFTDLGALVAEGAQGINSMIDAAHRLGIVLSDEAVAAGEQFNDRMDTMKLMLMSVVSEGLQPLLEAFNDVLSETQDVETASGKAATGFDGMASAARTLGEWLGNLVRALTLLGKALGALAAIGATAFGAMIEQAKVAASAIGDLNWNPFDSDQADDNARVWAAAGQKIVALQKQSASQVKTIWDDANTQLAAMQNAWAEKANVTTVQVPVKFGPDPATTDTSTESVNRNSEAVRKNAEAMREAKEAADNWAEEMATIGELQLEIAALQMQMAGATEEQANAWRMDQQAMSENARVIAGLTDDRDRLADSVSRLRKAQEDSKQATAEYNAELMRSQGQSEEQVQAYLDMAYGLSVLEVQTRKQIQATDEMRTQREAEAEEARAMTAIVAQGVGDVMMGLTESTDAAVEALKRLIVELLAAIATAQILKALNIAPTGGTSLFGAKGLAFDQAGLLPFAQGGIVTRATPFTFGGGRAGVMGEAGPEAIIPLTRHNGKLGVTGTAPNVQVFNYSGADVNVRADGDNLRIMVDQVRASLAADVARGGNPFTSAMERAYGVRR